MLIVAIMLLSPPKYFISIEIEISAIVIVHTNAMHIMLKSNLKKHYARKVPRYMHDLFLYDPWARVARLFHTLVQILSLTRHIEGDGSIIQWVKQRFYQIIAAVELCMIGLPYSREH